LNVDEHSSAQPTHDVALQECPLRSLASFSPEIRQQSLESIERDVLAEAVVIGRF
jgi:hypothetical protein